MLTQEFPEGLGKETINPDIIRLQAHGEPQFFKISGSRFGPFLTTGRFRVRQLQTRHETSQVIG